MSLVNKMLRDLDARHVGDSDRAALPAAVTPLAARQEPGGGAPWAWLGAVLFAAGLGAAAWYVMQSRNVPAATPPPPPAVTAAPGPVAAPEPAPVPDVALPSLRMAGELSEPPRLAAVPPRGAVAVVSKTPQASGAASPPQPVPPLSRASPVPGEVRISKQDHLPSTAERAEIEYRRGLQAQRQGNADEAAGSYRAVLEEYPEHAAARQALAALLIEARHFDDAEELLRKGTELPAVRLASTLALARLKVERNQAPAALDLLQKHAAAGERSAEYQGFAGALLNRAGRGPEAVERYQAATRLAPNEGRWWAGLGIALDAAGKNQEARDAYQKARALPGLPADLAQHIEQRLR